ncbi:hypothetical protein Peur_043462 [Populus x canadensis]
MIKLLQWLSSHEIVCRVICVTELRPGFLSFLFHFSCLFKMLRVLQLVAWFRFHSGALSPCFDHLLDLFLICFFQF